MLSPIYRLGFHLTDCIFISFFEARCPLYCVLYYICHVQTFKFLLYYYDIIYAKRALRMQAGD